MTCLARRLAGLVRDLLSGPSLVRALRRNREAADALDAAVREMLTP
ncbi:hypothetical protein SAMN05443573_104131 [Celeribacter indicus]|nr:hypothetical protein SAMN05443573_104131 [Celeribacter indicus]